MTRAIVVLAHHYTNWDKDGDDVEVYDEDTGCPRLVGVYLTARDAAIGARDFNTLHELDEDDTYGGPIESIVAYAAGINGAPGHGRHLVSFDIGDGCNATKYEAALVEAINKAGV